ncbi:UvrD-helicase domain-containing protein [Nitrolancea hollandica]|uniref:DNA 3'-5' helicase n=1 Tax=Nitrolancea hollandica Lb TaxID=1129897 RepID=I4ECB5_9BACT|nr:UvrD-helicase domain-containing protein [Nitrolancea hollandica]CCF82327.1 putative UvrD/REP helicase domain protein [Nitrolancea hollandica Lb]
MRFQLDISDEFWPQLLGLGDDRTMRNILKSIRMLQRDPLPDGDKKKKLKDWPDGCYRLKVGDYRVAYSLEANRLEVLWVKLREDAYRKAARRTAQKRDLTSPPIIAVSSFPKTHDQADGGSRDDPPLPRQIDRQLLEGLHVPLEYHQILLQCQTLNDLCEAQVPEDIRDWLFDCVTEPDAKRILEGKRLVVEDIGDLERKLDGEFVPFLLRLDSEQERVVNEIGSAGGPALVTGGPGSGKSIVALYSARSIVRRLRDAGTTAPNVLFATYTNALVKSSEQQLHEIFERGYRPVKVQTADAVAKDIVEQIDGRIRIEYETALLKPLISEARKRVFREAEGTKRLHLQRSVGPLSLDNLLTEIGAVIEAREIGSVEEYLTTKVPNRPSRLTDEQLRAIWQVSEEFRTVLREHGKITVSQLRRRALEIVRNSQWTRHYDAVIVDEAQDLELSLLRLLIALCGNHKHLLITADANQSIYPVWTDVHHDLNFHDRTWLLRTSHRTTRQIMEAARSYIREGVLDRSNVSTEFGKTGRRPSVRIVADERVECELLKLFFAQSTRQHRTGYGSCAVLVPTKQAARELAGRLTQAGIRASNSRGRELDLKSPAVKVLTLHTAKGLEFTAVAIAGFFSRRRSGSTPDQRRLMFVGMTRAMRELMVIRPTSDPSVRNDFDNRLWDIRDYPNQT